jgi:hypothetical protein
MQYSVDVASDALYDVEVRVASTGTEGKFHFQAGTADISGVINVPNTGDWQNWQTVTVRDLALSATDQKIRFFVDQAVFNLGSFKFIQKGATSSVAATFLSATTMDDRTIQLNINKPVAGPLPASPSGFQIHINGSPVTITGTTLNQENPRMITFSIGSTIRSTDIIRLSYAGNQIEALDGTVLNTFSQRLVKNWVAIVHPVPGKVEAEDFFFQSGLELETTSDAGGGQNIGYLDNGDYADYYIDVDRAGIYSVGYRTAALSERGAVKLELLDARGNASFLHEVEFPATGGWQSWATTSKNLTLPAGQQHLRMTITKPLFNINWFEFKFLSVSAIPESNPLPVLKIYPNPSEGRFMVEATLNGRQQVKYRVIGPSGQVIQENTLFDVDSFEETIDLGLFPDGMYLLLIQLENGTIHTDRLVKIH